MIPLILQLDEELKPGEEMIGIKTIPLKGGRPGQQLIGYVAIIKDFNGEHTNIRHGSLKAIQHKTQNFGTNVI